MASNPPTEGFPENGTDLQDDPHLHKQQLWRRYPDLEWNEEDGPKRCTLKKRSIVGSASGVDVPLSGFGVSRIHAEFVVREDGLWVTDRGSTNGTYVEDVRVESARVHDGARVRFGSIQLVVRYVSAPAEVSLWGAEHYGALIGRSSAMRELFSKIDRVAKTDMAVLVTGESGTGKELVARSIHENSARRGKPYVVVDCAALPADLVESELFGHVKGAFTGASTDRRGAFEIADGGTIFLDEVGELPLDLQPKLLRAVESKSIRRVGETEYRKVDIRCVSATHRDLLSLVNMGAFREDLYFRLCTVGLAVPALRARPQDIPLLVEHFLPEQSKQWSPEVMRQLQARPWMGNVRELRSFVRRAVALGADAALEMRGLHAAPPQLDTALPPASIEHGFKETRAQWTDHVERSYMKQMLQKHGRNMRQIADESRLDPTHVYRLVKKHDL